MLGNDRWHSFARLDLHFSLWAFFLRQVFLHSKKIKELRYSNPATEMRQARRFGAIRSQTPVGSNSNATAPGRYWLGVNTICLSFHSRPLGRPSMRLSAHS